MSGRRSRTEELAGLRGREPAVILLGGRKTTMRRLKLVELYDRGLRDFASLSPLERDVFVLNDLDIYYEMEGGFEDYLLSGWHASELEWLDQTLQRIGDNQSATIISALKSMDERRRTWMEPLCTRYYDLRHDRWARLKAYLAQQGAELDASP